MKVYTHYSKSHKDLYENYFKKSLRELYTKDELAIRSACHRQTTSAGSFMEDGWLESMQYKLEVILKVLNNKKLKIKNLILGLAIDKPENNKIISSLTGNLRKQLSLPITIVPDSL